MKKNTAALQQFTRPESPPPCFIELSVLYFGRIGILQWPPPLPVALLYHP